MMSETYCTVEEANKFWADTTGTHGYTRPVPDGMMTGKDAAKFLGVAFHMFSTRELEREGVFKGLGCVRPNGKGRGYAFPIHIPASSVKKIAALMSVGFNLCAARRIVAKENLVRQALDL